MNLTQILAYATAFFILCFVISIYHYRRRLHDEEDERNKVEDRLYTLQKQFDERNKEFRKIMESNLTAIPYLSGLMADFLTIDFEVMAQHFDWGASKERARKAYSIREIRLEARNKIAEAKAATYQLDYLLTLYPILKEVLETDYKNLKRDLVKNSFADEIRIDDSQSQNERYIDSLNERNEQRIKTLQRQYEQRIKNLEEQLKEQNEKHTNYLLNQIDNRINEFRQAMNSNLTAIPYLSGLMADFLTNDFEILAQKLDWGASVERAKKVQSIREIRREARDRIAEAKAATYQLDYLLALYPALEEVIETDYRDLKMDGKIPESTEDHDPVRDYLTNEQWKTLSEIERNQLALDRYIASRKKSKWQVGRDYELYVGYVFGQKGYTVDYFGSYMGMDDLGRDIIAVKNGIHCIVQCKYWSQSKLIHEKHIAQLFGTTISYMIEHNLSEDKIKSIFITNISLSPKAKEFARVLHVSVVENYPMKDFPRIKCNIGKDSMRIYHLPMDQQYDKTKIDKPGEFFAFTVQEAEDKGFRRAFKWYGQ